MRRGGIGTRRVVVSMAVAFAVAVLAPLAANAVVVICKKKSKITLRDTACKSKETLVAATELGISGPTGPMGPTGPTGNTGAAGPGAMWAFVAPDGTIANQSGGITLQHPFTGGYYIDFGVSLTGKTLHVSPAANGGSFQGVTAAQVCGSGPQGATCFQPGTDDDHHVFVYTTTTDNATETDEFFYVAAF